MPLEEKEKKEFGSTQVGKSNSLSLPASPNVQVQHMAKQMARYFSIWGKGEPLSDCLVSKSGQDSDEETYFSHFS